MPQPEKQPRVIIVGGGFGGLHAARELSNQPVDVTLIDRKNHHTFQPLLYQVALAVLSDADIASPLRHILRKSNNIHTIMAEVTALDPAARHVVLADGATLEYDYLILAAGARHSYFGHDDWEKIAPGLKTIEDAMEIRSRLLLAFEAADRLARLGHKPQPLCFAIIGGGPTGVELAGAIADLAHMSLAKDFKAIDTTQTTIRLYEGAPRVLATFSPKSSAAAERQLRELGVEVHTDSRVTEIEPGQIKVKDDWVKADVIVWASGVAASALGKSLGAPTDRAGRVKVEPDMSIPGRREIFVIGDMSTLTDAAGKNVPGLAAAALQHGKAVAQNILRDLRNQPRLPFTYKDRGTMATIGHHRAVAEISGRQFSGLFAWLLWSGVHIAVLTGFRNRVAVMLEWIWAYFTRTRGSTIITSDQQLAPQAKEEFSQSSA